MKLVCDCGNEMEFEPYSIDDCLADIKGEFEGVHSKIDSSKFHHLPYCNQDVELRCEKCGYAIWF